MDFIGHSLGRYHVVEQLGQGGMAKVYKAFDTRLERHVAIKVILPERHQSEEFLKRFEREAKALARLSHPNIVKVLDYGDHEGHPYLVMEYLPGGTLKPRLGKPVPWQEAAKILAPIARALGYAHEHKILHRDVKPSNILLTESGEPMLSDFGVAKMLEADQSLELTGTGVGIGTPEYMAPEQGLGKSADYRSDVYSLGIVFYELVVGRNPYKADTPLAVLLKHVSEPLPRPRDTIRDLPDVVERVLFRALAKRPEDRFPDMATFAQALEGLTQGKKVAVEKVPAAAPAGRKLEIRSVAITAGISLAALALVAIGATRLLGVKLVRETPAVPPSPVALASAATDTGPSPTAATNPASPTAEPTPLSPDPDNFVSVSQTEPTTLDPAITYEEPAYRILTNIYETLVVTSREKPGEFLPQLATDWVISEDGLTYTFTVRQGVSFHSADALDPADVVYTFRRGLLQGGTDTPQPMLTLRLFGADIEDVTDLIDPGGGLTNDPAALAKVGPDQLRQACERVQRSIVDNGDGTVSFRLRESYVPFLAIMSYPMASILDKDWVIANGGWDGDCATWQDYYGRDAESTPLRGIANGTGPYRLERWTKGKEIVLARFDDYWRTGDIAPARRGGPVGPAAILRVVNPFVEDTGTRIDMLRTGEADAAYVPADGYAEADALVGERCRYNGETTTFDCGPAEDPAGPLRVYLGYPLTTRTDVLFGFGVNEEAGNANLGSGRLDGNGIPTDFFADLHVRKAFNYCFDWDRFIKEAYAGEAVQNVGPLIPGVLGYDPEGAHYAYDPAQCRAEIEQAWGGQVASKGFWMQILSNEGNPVRQSAAEILRDNFLSLGSKFRIEVVSVPMADYTAQRREGRLPVLFGGWTEDIHDPDNWVYPFFVGVYTNWTRMPEELRGRFEELANQAAAERDPDTRAAIYRQIASLDYEYAVGIRTAVPTGRYYEQRWMEGWFYSPGNSGSFFYALSEK
jgi:peptide/nickel transport system substrate-binding protein